MHYRAPLLFGSHLYSNKGPFHGLQSFGVNLKHALSIGCSIDICSDELSPWAAKQYLLHPGLFQKFHRLHENICLSTASPFLISDLHVHKAVSHTLAFLNMFTQRYHQFHWWAYLCPVVGPLQSCCAQKPCHLHAIQGLKNYSLCLNKCIGQTLVNPDRK